MCASFTPFVSRMTLMCKQLLFLKSKHNITLHGVTQLTVNTERLDLLFIYIMAIYSAINDTDTIHIYFIRICHGCEYTFIILSTY